LHVIRFSIQGRVVSIQFIPEYMYSVQGSKARGRNDNSKQTYILVPWWGVLMSGRGSVLLFWQCIALLPLSIRHFCISQIII
jgi:hypothetical protein